MSYIDQASPADWDAVTKAELERYEATKVGRLAHPSDAARTEPERSLRYNNGKPDFSLLPLSTLTEVVRVLEYGAEKYERNNWLKPTSWDISFGCLMRHMSAWQAGEDNDPESGQSHLAHAACNILQMLHQLENHPEELER